MLVSGGHTRAPGVGLKDVKGVKDSYLSAFYYRASMRCWRFVPKTEDGDPLESFRDLRLVLWVLGSLLVPGGLGVPGGVQ